MERTGCCARSSKLEPSHLSAMYVAYHQVRQQPIKFIGAEDNCQLKKMITVSLFTGLVCSSRCTVWITASSGQSFCSAGLQGGPAIKRQAQKSELEVKRPYQNTKDFCYMLKKNNNNNSRVKYQGSSGTQYYSKII